MMESAVSFNAKALKVKGSGRRNISWGGEKEGSYSFITRIYGPDRYDFTNEVEYMDDDEKVKFFRNFFEGWMNDRAGESYRVLD